MKKLLLKTHRTIALGVGIFIVALCMSGTFLAFRDELAPFINSNLIVVPDASGSGKFERTLASARSKVPISNAIEIRMHHDPTRAAYVAFHGGAIRTLYINPYSGAIVADSDLDFSPFDLLFSFHRFLLLGSKGEYLVAIIGGLLLFMTITGLILWWPRRWANAIRVRWDGTRVALNFDAHKAIGSCIAIFY